MVADIRIKTSFPWHRKVRRLTRELGHDSTGYLLRLFVRTAMSRPDGCLRGMDAVDIACDADWLGDPQQFVDALLLCSWLDEDADGTLRLHDWAEHQAWVVREPKRVAAAKKGAGARWGGRDTEARRSGDGVPDPQKMPEVGSTQGENMRTGCGPDADRMRTGCEPDATSNAHSPSSSSTLDKGIKTPPERATALSTPHGGQRQPAKRFVPPSVEEIAAYCAERGNGIDAQAVHDHYTANGWRVGKNPMRDWRAAVRTWETKRRQEQHTRAAEQSPAARLLAEANGGTQQ